MFTYIGLYIALSLAGVVAATRLVSVNRRPDGSDADGA